MLYQVLDEIERANAPITLQALSQRLGIERGVLQGMIMFWVRKGRLRDDQAVDDCGTMDGGCGGSCGGDTAVCAFTVQTPRAYTLNAVDANLHKSGV